MQPGSARFAIPAAAEASPEGEPGEYYDLMADTTCCNGGTFCCIYELFLDTSWPFGQGPSAWFTLSVIACFNVITSNEGERKKGSYSVVGVLSQPTTGVQQTLEFLEFLAKTRSFLLPVVLHGCAANPSSCDGNFSFGFVEPQGAREEPGAHSGAWRHHRSRPMEIQPWKGRGETA